MPQIKSVICRQACVACWSDVLVKNKETSVNYFLFKAFSDAFLGLSGQIIIHVFNQSGQSDFIVIAIRAERLQIQTKTTHRQPTFTFRKCIAMSSGTLNKMNFQLFIEARIYSQPKWMSQTGALP